MNKNVKPAEIKETKEQNGERNKLIPTRGNVSIQGYNKGVGTKGNGTEG